MAIDEALSDLGARFIREAENPQWDDKVVEELRLRGIQALHESGMPALAAHEAERFGLQVIPIGGGDPETVLSDHPHDGLPVRIRQRNKGGRRKTLLLTDAPEEVRLAAADPKWVSTRLPGNGRIYSRID
jgi:hypothetical protein